MTFASLILFQDVYYVFVLSYKEISLEEALSGEEVEMTFSVNYRLINYNFVITFKKQQNKKEHTTNLLSYNEY